MRLPVSTKSEGGPSFLPVLLQSKTTNSKAASIYTRTRARLLFLKDVPPYFGFSLKESYKSRTLAGDVWRDLRAAMVAGGLELVG